MQLYLNEGDSLCFTKGFDDGILYDVRKNYTSLLPCSVKVASFARIIMDESKSNSKMTVCKCMTEKCVKKIPCLEKHGKSQEFTYIHVLSGVHSCDDRMGNQIFVSVVDLNWLVHLYYDTGYRTYVEKRVRFGCSCVRLDTYRLPKLPSDPFLWQDEDTNQFQIVGIRDFIKMNRRHFDGH